MTYLNSYNTRRNALNWPSSFGSLEKQLDSIFAGFPSFFDLEKNVGSLGTESGVKVRWYEQGDGYLARLDLPGARKEDISLEIEDGYLKVTATRKFESDDKQGSSFEYSKSFNVPEDVDAEKISATYEDGVLSLNLPKGEKAKPRQISVN
ncbi:Hsp20/alpha crystallin family protein [Pelagicoccus mobilis]|uniref:Hsp20/alpha crystallin family protein n=1 Tax=Pelagicoccus mobilis TaxID=415221 RepID=A0A934S2Z5_9BACT|nr:Hsp20/alpha crystallin family protein [Pelagicoccus mobilis]MBK1878469.1 Hsp20/alpha crystallin family protein [Pelagicoccus mobilis]